MQDSLRHPSPRSSERRRFAFVIVGLALLASAAFAPRSALAFGACCLGDNTCGDISFSDCPSSAVWWGEGTTCDGIGATGSPGSACDLGACCQRATPSSPNGSCDYTAKAECEGLCGKWMGGPSTCSQFQGGTCGSVFVNDPPLPCDCNEDGEVHVNELLTAVIIALCGDGPGPCCVQGGPCYYGVSVSWCPAADTDHDGEIHITELVQGVNAALGQCP